MTLFAYGLIETEKSICTTYPLGVNIHYRLYVGRSRHAFGRIALDNFRIA